MSLTLGIEVAGDGIGTGPRAHGIAALARRLEAAGVHYWVVGADRGEQTGVAPSLDPSLVATVAARHTAELGLVVAASTHRDHPYNLARRLLSVDHAARGRVGWFALDADRRIALNAAADTWTGATLAPAHTTESIDAVRILWRTWPYASLRGDRAAGVFADITQIRRADTGGAYRITGPLNVPGSVQGDLPVWRHPGPGARGADLVVVEDGDPVPSGAVVRLREADDAALARVARTPGAVGALLRVPPATVPAVLDEVLPAARRRGAVAAAGRGTLRRRLGLPAPAEPDLSTHRRAYDSSPTVAARL